MNITTSYTKNLTDPSLDVAAGYAAATVNYLSAAGQAFAQDLQKWGTTPTQPTGTNEPPN